MNCCQEAKAILQPLFEDYSKQLENQQIEEAAEYYDEHAVLVHIGKKAEYGREAVKRDLEKFKKIMGKSTTEFSGESYLKAGDFLIITANYESTTENIGTMKGKFTQIWRKSGDKYMIIHDEFSVE